MKKILFGEKTSHRKPPENLEKEDIDIFQHERKRQIKASYIFYEKSIYSFGSLIVSLRKLKYFQDYSFFGDKTFFERIKRIIKSFLYSSKEIIELERGTWFTDNKSHVYFHWLFDALERADIVSDYQIEYPLLVPEEYFDQSFVSESLEHLNYNYIVLKKNKIYRINDLLITSKTALTGNYNELILSNLVNKFKQNAKPINTKKFKNIFIYRDPLIGRSIYNFDDVKRVLSNYNYEIVALEDYSFSEKISLLNSCKNLVGLFGSGLSNMIFLNDESNLVEIRRKGDKKNNAFYSLASACKLNYYYQFFTLDNNGCNVDIKSLDNLLRDLE